MRVPPAPFDDGYDVRDPRSTRVGKESPRAAVLVFHRSAEGIRLCRPQTSLVMLTRFGAPPQMIEMNHQFHDGRRACVWNDDIRCSERLEMAQRLREGCVLSRCCSTSSSLRYFSSH